MYNNVYIGTITSEEGIFSYRPDRFLSRARHSVFILL